MDYVTQHAQFLTNDEKRGIAANQIPAFADELMDEDGQVRLFEDDPKEPEQIIVATDDVELTTATDTPQVTAEQDTPQAALPAATKPPVAPVVAKAIDATNDAFIQEMTAIISDGLNRSITKAGCAARIRGAINRYGKLAYKDGLVHGCVSADDFDEDDARIVGDISLHNTQYVTDMVNQIYADEFTGTAEARAQKWMGTTDEFYYAGIESADKNGLYSFEGDDGKENCIDCARLKGQKHRMSWWVEKELRPGIDHSSFECGTWSGYCNHYLERVGGC